MMVVHTEIIPSIFAKGNGGDGPSQVVTWCQVSQEINMCVFVAVTYVTIITDMACVYVYII